MDNSKAAKTKSKDDGEKSLAEPKETTVAKSDDEEVVSEKTSELKRSTDSFEEILMRSHSPSNISHIETVQTMPTDDGGVLKITRSVKEMVGSCPKIGASEAIGRQVREIKEHKSKDVNTYCDIKTESIEAQDGTKLKRTCQTARVRYTAGNRVSLAAMLRNPFSPLNAGDSSADSSSAGLQSQQQQSSITSSSASYQTSNLTHKNEFSSSSSSTQSQSHLYSHSHSVPATSSVVHINRDRFPLFIPISSPYMTAASYYSSYGAADKSTTSSNSGGGYNRSASYDSSARKYTSSISQHIDESYCSYGSPTKLQKTNSSSVVIKEIVPPTFAYEIENVTIKKGETAYFEGTINGTYPFEIVWYLDDYEIKPNEHYIMNFYRDYSVSSLTGLIDYLISLKIVNCTYHDIGKYTALVRNEAGNACCSAFLTIEGIFF